MRYIEMNPVVRHLLIQADVRERNDYFGSIARTAAVQSFYDMLLLDVEGGTICYWPLYGKFTVAAVGIKETPYISYIEVLALIRASYPRHVNPTCLTETDIESDDEMGWEVLGDEDIEVVDPATAQVEASVNTYKSSPPAVITYIGSEPIRLRTMLRDVG